MYLKEVQIWGLKETTHFEIRLKSGRLALCQYIGCNFMERSLAVICE